MVQKSNAGRDLDLLRIARTRLAIEIYRNRDLGFIRLSFDLCCSCFHADIALIEPKKTT